MWASTTFRTDGGGGGAAAALLNARWRFPGGQARLPATTPAAGLLLLKRLGDAARQRIAGRSLGVLSGSVATDGALTC
jgi:hypothetical protein